MASDCCLLTRGIHKIAYIWIKREDNMELYAWLKSLSNNEGAPENEAKKLLEACNGNLELAIDMHMDGGAVENDEEPVASSSGMMNSAALPGAQCEEDVRAPIPQKNETLVEDVPAFVLRGRRRQARSVFDGFRDFQAEARQQEEMMKSGSNACIKKRTLEDLFRPPIDITYKGTFANAREAGTANKKYVMVNVQNVKEFVCQAINRDVWSQGSVKAIIKDHFIFWQVYHDSEEGSKFTQFYKIKEWPYVAIIDPRTGENMVTWHKLDSMLFCELVTEFLNEHPFSDDSFSESPARKRVKRESSVVDLSEEDQLQAAIQASLQQNSKEHRTTVIIDSDSDSDDLETFSDTEEDYQPSPVKKGHMSRKDQNSNKNEIMSHSYMNDSTDSDNSVSEIPSANVLKDQSSKSQSVVENKGENSSVHSQSSCVHDNNERSYKDYLGSENDPQTSLQIKFPEGNRKQLSISCKSKLMALVLFVAENGFSNERYELLTNFPKRKLSYMDLDITIEEAGLHPQESVYVQAR